MKINRGIITLILSIIVLFLATLIGFTLGSSLAGVVNNANSEDFGVVKMAEASKLYDIKGRLISELFSEQKREIVALHEMPVFLIRAVLTREDREFFEHGGFNLGRTLKAAFYTIFGGNVQGASTITQQLAGLLYADRSERTIFRKIVELYYALQLERKLSKEEILELYLNQVYFGHGCYGVEAASQFLFGHSVRSLTPAEAVMLVIQIANWNQYSPLKNPLKARKMQQTILNDMVQLGYISQEEASLSFQKYWASFDLTRKNASAFLLRHDKAPYFTMYVLQRLDEILYGRYDVYTDGLQIYTTLNLDFQARADELMKNKLESVNKAYRQEINLKATAAESLFVPVVDILSLNFNMPHLHVNKNRHMLNTIEDFAENINPILDVTASIFGVTPAKEIAKQTYAWQLKRQKTRSIEGALVCLDPYTGYIYAMVGGKEFSSLNQLNYATQAAVQPGSSFKPLFYAAAIEEKKLSPSSILKDEATYFIEQSGKIYIPNNYGEVFRGDVSVREALAYSLNIPAINTLQIIGFDSAINMASKLLGVKDPYQIQATFPATWSLALGVINTSPLSMARAFASFVNSGKGIEPLPILYVKDRKGQIIANLENERLTRLQLEGLPQVMRPQTAYLMTNILQDAVKYGTLTYAKSALGNIKYPVAGKTGTTQNWHDAWTVGYTPYFVTAVWFGFDRGGGSLGTNRTGALLASPIWGSFMNNIHEILDKDKAAYANTKSKIEKELKAKNSNREVSLEDLANNLMLPIYWLQVIKEERQFERPPGLVDIEVCKKSGLRPSAYCEKTDLVTEIFYPECVPEKECTICKKEFFRKQDQSNTIWSTLDIPQVDTSGLPNPNTLPSDIDEYLNQQRLPLNKESLAPSDKPINPYLQDN